LLTAAAYSYLGAVQHTYVMFIPLYTFLLQKFLVIELVKKLFVKFKGSHRGDYNAVF